VHINEEGGVKGIGPVLPRLGRPYRRDEDAGAEAGARQVQVRRSLRRRAPRRGEVPRQGAHLLVPLAESPLGPENQRPELWRLYNTRNPSGRESIRVFPLSNWTELDIWQYIRLREDRHRAALLRRRAPGGERDGTLIMVDDDRMPLIPAKTPRMKMVRFRTLGCYPLTGASRAPPPRSTRHHPGNASDHHIGTPGPRDRPRPVRLDGKEKAGGLLLMRTRSDLIATDIAAYLEKQEKSPCCASSPAAASTTASRR
jgi:3'-phosphoadenosine 5'-phosphosulfate sulfotransferase (PAPS reductase)/FAD synthetase